MKKVIIIIALFATPAAACWLTFEGTLRCAASSLPLWSCGGDGSAEVKTTAGIVTIMVGGPIGEWKPPPPDGVVWLARTTEGHRDVRVGLGRDGHLYATDRDTLYRASWPGYRSVRTFLGVIWANDVSQCKAEWKGFS